MASKKHPGLPIPEDWDGQSWCRFAICWPDSLQWRAILAGYITTPMLGRTWDAATGSIIDTQAIGRDIFNRNLDWRYALVASCDDGTLLAEAIRYLADRLSSTGCCSSPGTVGGSGTGGAGSAPSTPVADFDPEGDPPEGYDTWEEYLADACKKAWWLINTISTDLGNMTNLQFAGATALSILPLLGAMLLDPIPGDELFLLAGVLIAMAYYGAATLDQVRDSLEDCKSDLVCDIYGATGPDSGKTAALQTFRTQIESDTADAVVIEYGVQLMSLMLSWDGLNKVYTLQEGITYPAGESDCSECTGLSTCLEGLGVEGDDIVRDEDMSGNAIISVTGVSSGGVASRAAISVPADCHLEVLEVSVLEGSWTTYFEPISQLDIYGYYLDGGSPIEATQQAQFVGSHNTEGYLCVLYSNTAGCRWQIKVDDYTA